MNYFKVGDKVVERKGYGEGNKVGAENNASEMAEEIVESSGITVTVKGGQSFDSFTGKAISNSTKYHAIRKAKVEGTPKDSQ